MTAGIINFWPANDFVLAPAQRVQEENQIRRGI